jgi:hypothetical protein
LCNVALADADHGGQHPPLERRRDRLVEVHSIKRLSPVQHIRTYIHTYIHRHRSTAPACLSPLVRRVAIAGSPPAHWDSDFSAAET